MLIIEIVYNYNIYVYCNMYSIHLEYESQS
jgi:hypothetical protein